MRQYNFTLVDGGDRDGAHFVSARGNSPEAALCNALRKDPELLDWDYACAIWYDQHGNEGYVDKNYLWLPISLKLER